MRSTRDLAPRLCALLCVACAAPPPAVPSGFASTSTAAEEAAPLSGSALQLRRDRLQRIWRDLVALQRSLESVKHREDSQSTAQLARFAGAYLYQHLEPLLVARWQSEHPELMAVDADLRLARIELLLAMRDDRRAQRALRDLEERFAGRESMLIDYPLGSQSPLEQALRRLRAAERG